MSKPISVSVDARKLPPHLLRFFKPSDGMCGVCYVCRMVDVFRAVRRVLTDDGTCWINLGDSYAGSSMTGGVGKGTIAGTQQGARKGADLRFTGARPLAEGTKPKDLLGIPWLVAFALRADGWYLRSSIVWAKPNAMPESVRDRPTKSHELIFLLSKQAKYYYDAESIKEPIAGVLQHVERRDVVRGGLPDHMAPATYSTVAHGFKTNPAGRNKRDVWTVSTKPYAGAHFATMPPALVEPCVLAGSAAGDTILDPFAGSGTTGAVAVQHGRAFIGIDLNATYLELAKSRIAAVPVPLPIQYERQDSPATLPEHDTVGTTSPNYLTHDYANTGKG